MTVTSKIVTTRKVTCDYDECKHRSEFEISEEEADSGIVTNGTVYTFVFPYGEVRHLCSSRCMHGFIKKRVHLI